MRFEESAAARAPAPATGMRFESMKRGESQTFSSSRSMRQRRAEAMQKTQVQVTARRVWNESAKTIEIMIIAMLATSPFFSRETACQRSNLKRPSSETIRAYAHGGIRQTASVRFFAKRKQFFFKLLSHTVKRINARHN